MQKTNDCRNQISLEQREKSVSRLKEEDSVINRLNNIRRQVYKWSKQKNAYLGEEFFDRFFLEVVKIEEAFYSFPDGEDYDSRKYYS